MKTARLRILPVLLMILLGFLQYHLWFDTRGLVRMYRLKKELLTARQTNEKMKERNEALHMEVNYLRQKSDAMESEAREELGMVRRGEIFYHQAGEK